MPTNPEQASLPSLQIVMIFAVVFVGFFWFIRIAIRQRSESWRLKTFFLGGANIGPELTEQNTIGITFAWSGGLWFYVTLAYHNGPWVVLMQIPWMFSILLLAFLFRRILPGAKNRTIHGFLAERYGWPVQKVAAVATTIGYVLIAGFEMFWASLLFAQVLGRPDLAVPTALLVALITGAYCAIGGYISNVTTDKPQNLLGVAALAGLLILMASQATLGTPLNAAITVFAIGSVIYVAVSTLLGKVRAFQSSRFQSSLALAFGFVALIVTFVLMAQGNADAVTELPVNPFKNLPLSPDLLIGLLSFLFIFNAVDMQNWQSIAANGDAQPASFPKLQWSLVRAAIYILWFPALGGMLIGCALRMLSTDLSDQTIFNAAFAQVLPHAGDIVRGLVIGVLLLGLLSTSLSTADSLVMSGVQTLTYDILWTKKLEHIHTLEHPEQEEEAFVRKARLLLIPLALLMTLVFWRLWVVYKGEVLNFQSMMYASALSLFAPVMFALFRRVNPTKRRATPVCVGVCIGMCAAIAAVLVMFIVASQLSAEDPHEAQLKGWLLNLMPIVSNGISLVAYGLGSLVARFSKE
jgi:hypothetical protein